MRSGGPAEGVGALQAVPSRPATLDGRARDSGSSQAGSTGQLMGLWVEAALILVAILGHVALWTGIVNRIHATGMPRWMIKGLTVFFFWTVPVVPMVLAVLVW